MNYDPAIPIGESQLDYYKSGYGVMDSYLKGLQNDQREMLTLTERLLPMYMYEGNMTRSDYYGRVGQAVAFTDYYTTVPLYGTPDVCVFVMNGGQWGLVKDLINFEKRPLFYAGKYINTYCTGALLETTFTSGTKIYDGSTALDLDPVGCKAYTDSTSYSVALFSRDFEHDYIIQVDIPDGIKNATDQCKLITLSGESYSSETFNITEENFTGFSDSILVTVPKYGMVILRFDGTDQHYTNVPDYYADIKRAASITLSTPNDVREITRLRGTLKITATILPEDAFLKNAKWEILDNEVTQAYIDGTTSTVTLYANSKDGGNGTVRVVATTRDGSSLSDTISIRINQPGVTAIETIENEQVKIYPVPAGDYVKLAMPEGERGKLTVVDLNGKALITQAIASEETTVDVSSLDKGIYLIRVETGNKVQVLKFTKI
jgi:hypothetical protein